jgi:hypothetical protein
VRRAATHPGTLRAAALRTGVCTALPAAAVAAFSLQAVGGAEMQCCVDALSAAAASAAGGGEEAAETAAAATLAGPALLDAALYFGFVGDAAAVRATAEALTSSLAASAAETTPTGLRAAAALGVGNLLGAQAALPGMSPLAHCAATVQSCGVDAGDGLVEPVAHDPRLAPHVKAALKALEAAVQTRADAKVRERIKRDRIKRAQAMCVGH